MSQLLVGALVGGLISLVSALAVDVVRSRREDQRRWDRDKLVAAIDFVGAAQDLAGDQYRRGRSARGHHDPQHPERLARDEEARQSLSHLWVCAARAELLIPYAKPQAARAMDTGRAIRDRADEGFDSGDEGWASARTRHQAAIEDFSKTCGLALRLAEEPIAPG